MKDKPRRNAAEILRTLAQTGTCAFRHGHELRVADELCRRGLAVWTGKPGRQIELTEDGRAYVERRYGAGDGK